MQSIDRLSDSLIKPVVDEDTALAENGLNLEDSAWLNADLSNLGAYEPYEWAEGELEEGKPVKYIPGKGCVIEA